MKGLILFVIWFLCFQNLYAQHTDKFSITFDETSLKEALLELENLTHQDYYFQESWLEDIKVSGAFKSQTLDFILKTILQDTSLNYLIYNDTVIFTQNSLIVDTLPSVFFNEDLKSAEDSISDTESNLDSINSRTPVLIKQYTNVKIRTGGTVVAIGKASKSAVKKRYKITGLVKDLNTNRPIPDLIVNVVSKDINAVTDSNGNYELKLPSGSYIIETKSIAYETNAQEVVVYGDGNLDFSLIESLTLLDEVLIENDRDANVKEVMSGVTSIDVEAIKTVPLILGERDVLKVATTMPGIKTNGEGALGYNVRGGKTDQNLILMDDAVMYNPSHFFGIFSAINPFTTGSVNIYKGSVPAEFGGRLSSVIDMTTKSSNTEKFSAEGSIGPVTGNLAVEVPIAKNKSSIIAGVRATYSDWILNTIDEETISNSEASFYDGIIKYSSKIDDKNDVSAMGFYSKDKFSITSDSLFDYSNRLASLKWNHTFDNKNRGTITLANTQYKFKITYDSDFNNDFGYDYTLNETELKLNMKYLMSKQHKFDYGISSKLYNIEPGNIKPLDENSNVESNRIEKEKALESAIFISDLFKINDKLSLDLGLRYSLYFALGPGDYNVYDSSQPKSDNSVIETKSFENNAIVKTYGGLEYRLSGRYFLSPTLSVKGSYNKTLQYIHLLSSNTTMSPVDTWKLSDLNIKPQVAHQVSFGIFKNFSDNNYELSFETYYKKMSDILDFKIGAQLSLNENIETEVLQGKGKAYGLELLVKKNNGKLNGWLSYSYSRSLIQLQSQFLTETINNGNYFPANYDRPHDFNIVSNFRLTKRYSFSMNFNYQTGRPLTYPVGKFIFNGTEQVIYSDRNKARIPDYYRLDLGVNIEGSHKLEKLAHSFINISVYNVLGRSNPYSVFYVNNEGSIQAYKTSIFAIPIPTITYNFKF
ncbi:carboxypeptidase-like regulatory domain-containing protein [Winogradskyella schleiferi]|uniref:carboxypeptidase-like regulatory domain-containing protein n=1 Tax=Winogradskyella schleiferi TaxID=2686078 RepID=UPI0015B96756|nr:carboxypeptidase-like regulatory domain-containing protein [Winogradskyella schleiferi]